MEYRFCYAFAIVERIAAVEVFCMNVEVARGL